jgi:hypothetical protein
MHKWMQSAAGGTSQRLKPAVAIVRSLSRNPAPAPGTLPALLIVVIAIFPCSPLLKRVFLCRLRSHVVSYAAETAPILLFHAIPECARSTSALEKPKLLMQ